MLFRSGVEDKFTVDAHRRPKEVGQFLTGQVTVSGFEAVNFTHDSFTAAFLGLFNHIRMVQRMVGQKMTFLNHAENQVRFALDVSTGEKKCDRNTLELGCIENTCRVVGVFVALIHCQIDNLAPGYRLLPHNVIRRDQP